MPGDVKDNLNRTARMPVRISDKFAVNELGRVQFFDVETHSAQAGEIFAAGGGGAGGIAGVERPAACAAIAADFEQRRPERHGENCDVVERGPVLCDGGEELLRDVVGVEWHALNRSVAARVRALGVAAKFGKAVRVGNEQCAWRNGQGAGIRHSRFAVSRAEDRRESIR